MLPPATSAPRRFLVTNAVPLNGGDEALLRALLGALTLRWPNSQVTVLCKAVETARQLLPDLTLLPDLEFIERRGHRRKKGLRVGKRRSLVERIDPQRRLRTQWELLQATGVHRDVLQAYQQADMVLSAPGGFLNDYYSLRPRLEGFELARNLGKPVVLCSQSVGPFWKEESLERAREALGGLAGLCVRDAISVEYLRACGVSGPHVHETADAAFLWRRLAPELFRKRQGVPKRLALCFRSWPPGGKADNGPTIEKALALCHYLLAVPERRLLFLSTCQGVPGYRDDTEIAQRIVAALSPAEAARCDVETQRLSPRELIQTYGECDAYIGMRLHGAVLSMLGGTPALGLGYETKTEQIFGQLGLGEYQVAFDAPLEGWLEKADRLLRDHAAIHARLPALLDQQCARAETILDVIESCLPGERGTRR